jgi:MtN3 and saliva related transmembrane protein
MHYAAWLAHEHNFSHMMNTEILGLVAGSFTTLAFLPQVIKTWKSRSAKDISLGMFLLFSTGVALWLVYGLEIGALPIIIANSITLILSLAILAMKFWFGRREKTGSKPY